MWASCIGMLMVGAVVSSCGGSKNTATSTVPSTSDDSSAPPVEATGPMESAEALDGINRALDRKRPMAARCLSEAVDRKELPGSARGKMTLGFTISADGKASAIKVIKSTLESEQLVTCVVGVVERITFPTLGHARDWSYTYAFEAM
ncbi:MAG: AgmX/PglI C-terminal domain-containing protein [Kofleriaceae bacterium]|nr:AgmX/PglI C-terminal domain-containing protein [Kofleriaceae bacterium]